MARAFNHNPPHVHVVYGDHEAMIEIESGRVRGAFPPRALGMALEWTRLRQHDLLEDWDLVRRHLVPKPIAPLDWMFAFDLLEARFVRDRVVWLRFRDGTSGEVELTPELWGEAFAPLHDTACFRRFRVEGNTLVWPNDVDLAAEFLHEQVRISTRS